MLGVSSLRLLSAEAITVVGHHLARLRIVTPGNLRGRENYLGESDVLLRRTPNTIMEAVDDGHDDNADLDDGGNGNLPSPHHHIRSARDSSVY